MNIKFSKMFSQIPKIHSFWIDLAKDEEKHARTLEDIHGSLDDGHLK